MQILGISQEYTQAASKCTSEMANFLNELFSWNSTVSGVVTVKFISFIKSLNKTLWQRMQPYFTLRIFVSLQDAHSLHFLSICLMEFNDFIKLYL